MRPLALRASVAITLGITAGVSLTCEPRVSLGDNVGEPLVIGYVPKSYSNPVFTQAYVGALQAEEDFQQNSGRKVTIPLYDPPDVDKQQYQMARAITAAVNGILVSCASDDISTSIDQADVEGIPVITFDSDCPSSKKRLGFFGTDNLDAGREAADLLVQAMNDKVDEKRVAIVTGSEEATNLNDRIQGFNNRISEAYPSVTVLDTVYCKEEDPDLCSALLDKVVGDHEDLDGLFVVGLWGVQAACNACKSSDCECDVPTRMSNWHAAVKERNLKTVAFDALPFELELMKEGYLSALIGQKYYEWGYCTTSRMVKYITRGEPVKFSAAGYDIVANDQDVGKMISRWNEVYNGHLSASPADCGDGDAGP